jgi:hypothetical protein
MSGQKSVSGLKPKSSDAALNDRIVPDAVFRPRFETGWFRTDRFTTE